MDPGLAMGWSIALGSGTFAVPAVALLTGAALVAALAVGRRIRTTAPAPYLSGAAMTGSTPSAFHGGLGRPINARSGGFYWGAGREAPSASPGREPGEGPAIAASASGIVARTATIAGWLLIGLIGLAAAVGTMAGGAAP